MAIERPEGWPELLRLRLWTPLSEVDLHTLAISENVRKIKPTQYVFVVDSDLHGDETRTPYITMIMWAGSDGAALRAADGDLEADTKSVPDVEVPRILLPDRAFPEYESILKGLKTSGEDVLESGEYRIASDGAFIQRVIRGRRGTYCFRSPEDDATEKPFAILITLS